MTNAAYVAAVTSVESSEWYTTTPILDCAREALGGEFDLDPASNEIANVHVRAKRIHTIETPKADRGPWRGRIFHNPPNPARPWWDQSMAERVDAENAHEPFGLIYVAYSIEALQQSQGWSRSMLDFPLCIPRQRVRYMCTAEAAIVALTKTLAKRASKGSGKKFEATRAELKWLDELRGMSPLTLVQGDAPTHASAIIGVGVDRSVFRLAFRALGEVANG